MSGCILNAWGKGKIEGEASGKGLGTSAEEGNIECTKAVGGYLVLKGQMPSSRKPKHSDSG